MRIKFRTDQKAFEKMAQEKIVLLGLGLGLDTRLSLSPFTEKKICKIANLLKLDREKVNNVFEVVNKPSPDILKIQKL